MVWRITSYCKRAYQFIFVLTAFVLLERMSEHAVEESHASTDEKLARRGPMRIEAKDLSFTYPGTDAPVLKDINLTIEPGQSVAIVGFNGGGKCLGTPVSSADSVQAKRRSSRCSWDCEWLLISVKCKSLTNAGIDRLVPY